MLRYKACRNSIVTLELLNSSVTNEKRNGVVDDKYAKFRCDMAKVVNITNVETGEKMERDNSIYKSIFYYRMGEIVITNFEETINTVCGAGIHYFKTKEAALSWFYKQPFQYPDGKWIDWYENGQKKSEETYKDGKIDGKCIGWHENGKKSYEGTYKDGKIDGKWTEWWDNGNKQTDETYNNGKLDGKWTDWYSNGQIKLEGTYKDGYHDGKWTQWYNNGNKIYEGIYKDGQRNGKWTDWYSNGQIKLEGTYKDGHGNKDVKYWDENGKFIP